MSAEGSTGLLAELRDSGRWLYRRRGYVPLALLAFLLVLVLGPRGLTLPLRFGEPLALSLTGLGLAIRGWTLGYVRPWTSSGGSRAPDADALNTDGPYSLVRHPLYLGNLLMWLGVAVLAGSVAGIVITVLFFWLHHERIMLVEEDFLRGAFGTDFEAWCRRTPAFVPSLRGWTPPQLDYSLRFALVRDFSAVLAAVVTLTGMRCVRAYAERGAWTLSRPWWTLLAVTVAYYAVMVFLKKRTRVLDVPGR